MSRLQSIENALSSINEAAFQELCDSFLALRNSNYSAFSRTGSQSGKQKTVKGTPDTFLLLPNGRYIFVEYSTNISKGISKLQDDVKKCLNTVKTGIPIDQIVEVILCINFNLKTYEIQAMKDLLVKTGIALTVYTLDSLALELHLHHRDLAHEYLGLPLDTGQIVSIDRFVVEYNKASKRISTPLDNTFLHREQELKEFKELVQCHDLVILTGAPGVGKTKLAIEGIISFLSEDPLFKAYCVSYKNHTLLNDLYQYIKLDKDYILFVDDANRIDAFGQIIGFYKAVRKGRLKIVITVRDYAFQEIKLLCKDFSPQQLDLSKLADEQIVDIIKARPFDVLNPDYHKEIVRIADGNPRLAIMTALLAKAEQNIYALHDVSDLFENYFSTFIEDEGEFAKPFNMQCLGLIAFFHAIPYKNREVTTSIIEDFGIAYSDFIDAIDRLDQLELVEVQFDHVKIPEQNLSTYFFYKAVIQDGLIDFDILLAKYFKENRLRFKDTVIPAYNLMNGLQIEKQLKPKLQIYWKVLENKEKEAFDFLDIFWYMLMDEALEFAYEFVESLQDASTEDYQVAYEDNAFSYNRNNFIELVGEFFRFQKKLDDALGLGFEFVRKRPEHMPELLHKIREQMTFDAGDELYGFARQTTLFRILIDGLNKNDVLLSTAFYELSKTFLSFEFQHTKGGRNRSFYLYRYPVPNTHEIQQFRKRIWEAIAANFKIYPNESFELLQSYARICPDVSKELMEFDVPMLIEIIGEHLSPNSFESCRYVQEQIRWCERNSIIRPSFISLARSFTNPIYEIFLKIDWDRWRDKEMYEFDDYSEYEKLKEVEIRSSFVLTNIEQALEFYSNFIFLKNAAKNDWNYNATLDFVIDENCTRDFDLGCGLLSLLIEKNNEVKYIPRVVFRNHLKTNHSADQIWGIIQKQEFVNKSLWELSFYDYLDDSLLSKDYALTLINTISNTKESNIIHFDRLKRFLDIVPKLFQIILSRIVEKNEKEGVKLQVWVDFFSEHFDKLGNDIELIKKAYLQQDRIHNHFDHRGSGFLKILKKDSGFILDYINSLYSYNHFRAPSERRLSFVWQIDNIEQVLIPAFDFAIEKELHMGVLPHFCNSFFYNLNSESKERARRFLVDYCKINLKNSRNINVVVDIVRHSMKELFEEILLLFLSLTQDKAIFSKIWWRGNGGSYSGDVIIGDIQAAEWRSILSIVEKSPIGIKLIPIKKYVNEQIDYCLKSADLERQRKFLERY